MMKMGNLRCVLPELEKKKKRQCFINLIIEAWFKVSSICSNESYLTNTDQFLSPKLKKETGRSQGFPMLGESERKPGKEEGKESEKQDKRAAWMRSPTRDLRTGL